MCNKHAFKIDFTNTSTYQSIGVNVACLKLENTDGVTLTANSGGHPSTFTLNDESDHEWAIASSNSLIDSFTITALTFAVSEISVGATLEQVTSSSCNSST